MSGVAAHLIQASATHIPLADEVVQCVVTSPPYFALREYAGEQLRQWGEDMEYIVLAGDDDQTVYAFKGATPDAFLHPDLPREQEHVLDQSYRMPIDVYLAAQSWIDQLHGQRREKEYAPRDAVGAVLRDPSVSLRDPDALVDYLAHTLAETPQNDIGERRTLMVLSSCGYQLQGVVKALRARGMLFHNPYRRKRGDWNPLRATRGHTTAQRLVALMRGLRDGWTYGDLTLAIELVRKTGIVRRGQWDKIVTGQPEDRFVSPDAIRQLFEDGVIDALRTAPLDWIEAHAASAKQQALEYPLRIAKRDGIDGLTREPQIIIGTVHSVKGGQADDVFLFPDLSPAGYIEYASEKTRANVIRWGYVGMSRARERLWLGAPSTPASVIWQSS